MNISSSIDAEAARLLALQRLKILDTPPEQAFDELTRLAAYVCDTPIAAISFIDAHRQWLKSKVGLDVSQIPKDLAFCTHAILQPDPMIVADALLDSRFATNPLVTDEPRIRFYAGAPIITSDGYVLGTLHVIDRLPRELNLQQIAGLKTLSRQVVMQVELRRNLNNLTSVDTICGNTALALQQSEERFRNLVETSSDWVWELNENFVCTYSSPKVYDILGYKPEELHSKTPFDFMSKSEASRVAKIFAPIAANQQPYTCLENTHIHKDGYPVVLEVSGIPVFDQSGKFRGYRGMARDVTERKVAVEALRESEERFRQLAENINQVFWIISKDGSQMLYVSPAYQKIWDRSCTSLYQQPSSWLDAIHPEDKEQVMAAQKKLPLGNYNEEYRIVRSDESVRWIRSCAFPIQNEMGQLYRFAGISEDITEHKRVDEEIRFLHSMKQAIFESEDFHAALRVSLQKVCEATSWDFGEAWIKNSDGSRLQCSSAWYGCVDILEKFRRASQEMTFLPGVGLPGRVWVSKQPEWQRDVSAEPSEIYLRAQLANECGLKAALGIPLIANDVVIAVLVFYMFESCDEDKRLIELISASTELGLFIQRKQAEEEIRLALLKEKELNDLKSRFITTTSHEFRTPIATIMLSAGLLKDYSHKWSEEKKLVHFERIEVAVARMTQMMEDVMFIGTAEAGKLQFHPAMIDLEKFCHSLVEEQQLSAGSKYEISFVNDCRGIQVELDEKLLRHILINLLSNAIKYSPDGGMIHLEIYCHDEVIFFQVKDQGVGIPLTDQKRLFESFHRASNVGNISGTGLGLAIVKTCVDLHGGQITLESEVGVGTAFTVTLPLKESC